MVAVVEGPLNHKIHKPGNSWREIARTISWPVSDLFLKVFMQENRIVKILTLILGAVLFIFQRDIAAAFVFLCSMIFYVTLSQSEARKSNELDSFRDDFKKLKDRVDAMAITRALR